MTEVEKKDEINDSKKLILEIFINEKENWN